jgi:hypothetical protein
MLDARLIEYAATPLQRERLQAWLDHGSQTGAAKALGCDARLIRKAHINARKRAARDGYAPGHFEQGVAPGYRMGKVTVQRDADGEIVQTWERQSPEAAALEEELRQVIAALKEDMPAAEPVPRKWKQYLEETACMVIEGDPHSGALAWKEDTGNTWDIEEFERVNQLAIDRLTEACPPSRLGVLLCLGDIVHSPTGNKNRSESGHQLDCDGRFYASVRAAVRVKKYQVLRMLERHEHVEVKIMPGNHDGSAAYYIADILAEHYRNEPRVTVHTDLHKIWYWRFGQNMIAAMHGDTIKKMSDIPMVMAADEPVMWGATSERQAILGHFHSSHRTEFPGASVEKFRTLAGRDYWHHSSGYRSKREITAMVLHAEHGREEVITRGMRHVEEPDSRD